MFHNARCKKSSGKLDPATLTHSSLACRFNSKTRTLRPLVLNLSKVNYSSLNYNGQQQQSNRNGYRRRLLQQPLPTGAPYINTYRAYGMLVARILRSALKLRYLVLGGTIGGGAALSNVSPRNLRQETNHDIIPRASSRCRNTSNGRTVCRT